MMNKETIYEAPIMEIAPITDADIISTSDGIDLPDIDLQEL